MLKMGKFSRLLTRKRLLQQKADKTRRSTLETQIKVIYTLKSKKVYTSRVFLSILCQSYAKRHFRKYAVFNRDLTSPPF